MKKLLTISLAVIMVLAMAISLVGCGVTDIIDNIGGGGNGGGEEKTVDMETKKAIKTALGDNYEITLKYGYASSEDDEGAAYITTKKAGEEYFTEVIDSDGDKEYFLVVDGKSYSDANEEGKFWYCTKMGEYDLNQNAYDVLMQGYDKTLTYTSKKTGKFLERDVTIYTWEQSSNIIVASFSVKHEYVVDKATGLILKRVISYSGSSMEDSSSATSSFEVTKIKVGGVTLTEEKKKIAIDEWIDDADFTKFGINPIAKIDAEFSLSRGHEESKEYVYKLTSETAESTFNTLANAFYSAGFKNNYDCEEQTKAELTTTNSHQKEFHGYKGGVSFADYGIKVTLENPYYEGSDYKLTITVYDNTVNDYDY